MFIGSAIITRVGFVTSSVCIEFKNLIIDEKTRTLKPGGTEVSIRIPYGEFVKLFGDVPENAVGKCITFWCCNGCELFCLQFISANEYTYCKWCTCGVNGY